MLPRNELHRNWRVNCFNPAVVTTVVDLSEMFINIIAIQVQLPYLSSSTHQVLGLVINYSYLIIVKAIPNYTTN